MAKILVLDIEWKPATAYVWKAWDENIGPDQVIDAGGLLCWAAKFVGEKEIFFASEWTDGHEAMVVRAHDLLSMADAVVTYNGDKYDIPKLRGEFILAGLRDIPPVTSIDCIKSVKKFGFLMNRLAFIGPFLAVGGKMKHEGFSLWVKVMNGDPAAQARMKKYNIKDVTVLEKLYKRIKPFIKNHPHMGEAKQECGACGSTKAHSRGYRRTKFFKVQRLQCQDCGSWSEGTRTKV